MQSLSELSAEIAELLANIRIQDNWTKHSNCPNCGARVHRGFNGHSHSMEHKVLHCGRHIERLLKRRQDELSLRLYQRKMSRRE